jgi:hypothetical protein
MNSPSLFILLALGAAAVFADGPRLFIAPFSAAGGAPPSAISTLNAQFKEAVQREGRFRLVEKQVSKVKSSLYGAMGAKASNDCQGLDCQLATARGLEADKMALGTISRRAGGLLISVSYVDVKSGKVEAVFSERAPQAADPILLDLEKMAISLETRLPPRPRIQARWPIREAKPFPLRPAGLVIGGIGFATLATSVIVELVASYSPDGAYAQYASYVPPTPSDVWQVQARYRTYTDILVGSAAARAAGITAAGAGTALFIAGILTRKAAAKKTSQREFHGPGVASHARASDLVFFPMVESDRLGVRVAASF